MNIIYKKPLLSHLQEMQDLVGDEVKQGLILPRSPEEMAQNIRSYYLALDNDKIIGFCALHIYTPRLAEIRSLVVAQDYRNQGIAQELVARNIAEGKSLGIQDFLVLTYRPNLFKRMGFEEIAKEKIPYQKIWMDCVACKHFPTCHEIALLKTC
ncbi:GNAT family acetyltransferase [Helicobacter mustelae]|uniref:N-acetyltransferase n=1 Tax=Helicobacter mustelae TaxID=217 RepID=UPI000E07BFB1|nr:N-acetyltransferase [Helicobacter mustelae]STP13044.1 GNAT family acetyltransferase [Helicobacter mustelae]